MKRTDVERRLKNAVSHCVPDVLEQILSECGEQKGSVTIMKETQKKKSFFPALCAAAAAFLLLAGGGFGFVQYQENYRVESVIGFDVNPSMELEVNAKHKIVTARALNQDAGAVLDGMDLKGADLNVALHAVIGSMLRNGYISDLQNSILITVDSGDEAKGKALEQQLMSQIDEILLESSISPSLIAQSSTHDPATEALSEEYGISQGKAKLIQEIAGANPAYSVKDLAGLSINELNLLSTSKKTETAGVVASGNASTKAYIEASRAQEIAYSHAGVAASAVTKSEVEFDYENGRIVYEVEFKAGGYEYDYQIDAQTGEIATFHQKPDDDARHSAAQTKPSAPPPATSSQSTSSAPASSNQATPASSSQTASPNAALIGTEKARAAAYAHAGVAAADVYDVSCELDQKRGVTVYEVDFKAGGYEYDYQIDAATGGVLRNQKELDDDRRAVSSGGSASSVGTDQAREIALRHAGVAVADVYDISCELDREHGASVYEVDFKSGGYEYDYKIDAATGEVLSFHKEYDD